MRSCRWILFFILSIPIFTFASGTVVGNGGEPVLHFLEATRFALTETLKDIHLDPKINAEFCSDQPQLSSIQKQFCRSYLLDILDQMLALNTEPKKVPFVLREDPLLVIGPDGKPMPVSARTDLGEAGPIEFHLDSIKLMAPKVLLQLISHEFQHKTTYMGRSPTDNDPLGPFQFGRQLIDSVADAIVKVAIKKGRVGTEFVLRDSFDCAIRSGASQFFQRAATNRWFLEPTLVNYNLSLSERPSDPFIAVGDVNSKIVYQLEVADSNHCADLTDLKQRSSTIRLWRVFDDPNAASVLLSEQVIEGMNPICEKTPPSFVADYQSVHFDCRYYGSAAY